MEQKIIENVECSSSEIESEEEPPVKEWVWQLRNRIKSVKDLKIDYSENVLKAEEKFPLAITPYYYSLIKEFNYNDPIFAMSVPNSCELTSPSFLSNDPLAEEHDMPVPNLVHRYKDRALILVTDMCAMYCRHSLSSKTKITMSDFSSKEIKDVNIGEKIVTHAGKIETVYDVFNRDYDKDVLIIETTRKQKIETTQEHPFLVLKRNSILCNSGKRSVCKPNSKKCLKRHPNRITEFNPKFIEAAEIEVGDYLCVPCVLDSDNQTYCDEDFAYFLGLYVAEGDIPKRKNGKPICIRFSFNYNEEKTLAKKIKDIVEKLNLGKISIKANKAKSLCNVRVYNEQLANEIEICCGRLSDKKILSEDLILNSSKEFKKSLLNGMLDGDGYFSNKYKKNTKMNSVEFNTVSYQLSNQIFMLLVSLGYMPSVYRIKENRKELKINGRKVKSFKIMNKVRILDYNGYCNFLNKPIEKTSKSESFCCNGYVYCKVEKINFRRPYLQEKFYDLSITGDESYLAEFAAVHNCTRKRVAGQKQEGIITNKQLGIIVQYLKEHFEIKDVIVSGGDPFTLPTNALENIISNIRSVSSVETIRIGTRTPVTLPMRIDDELIDMLKKYHPIWINTHFNHPNEITDQSIKACEKLVNAGFPLGNQTVLLKGINDKPEIIEELCRKLIRIRVRPYYLFQCDLIKGAEHFRTKLQVGIDIMKYLRGRLSGIAIPNFVVDAPNGGGKIELLPESIVSSNCIETILKNFEGKLISYPDPI